jgi:hypothetical protein
MIQYLTAYWNNWALVFSCKSSMTGYLWAAMAILCSPRPDIAPNTRHPPMDARSAWKPEYPCALRFLPASTRRSRFHLTGLECVAQRVENERAHGLEIVFLRFFGEPLKGNFVLAFEAGGHEMAASGRSGPYPAI